MPELLGFCAGVIAGVLVIVAALGIYIYWPRPKDWEWW